MKNFSNQKMGRMRHNLANEEEFRFTMERLGGEGRLKKNYPELYKILQYSSKQEKRAANGVITAPIEEASQQMGGHYGLTDSVGIRTLNYDADTTAYTSSGMSMVEKNKSLVIVGELYDITNNMSLDGFAVAASDAQQLDGEVMFESPSLMRSSDYEFQAISTFSKIVLDGEGKERWISETHKKKAIKVLGASSIVEKLVVEDPMPKRHPGAKKTILYYNNRHEGEFDYYYNNVNTKDYKVEVCVDFSGSVTFKEGFSPRYVDKNNDFSLQMGDKGAANFNMGLWDKIRWSVSGRTLSWKFPSNWQNWLDSSQFHLTNDAWFYCKMCVMTERGIAIPIVISSMDIQHKDPSYCKINPITIEWGCFAKGTRILMADQTYKPIEEIRRGDLVKTQEGSASVEEVIRGREDVLAMIGTSRGKRICVTADHPMLTQDGWKRADELAASDVLEMYDGKDAISELHLTECHGEVFSIRIDSEEALIAEGFYTGDFGCQNRIGEREDQPPQKKEGYQQELEALVAELDCEMKRDRRG